MDKYKFYSILYYVGMALVLVGILTRLGGSIIGGFLLAAGCLPIVGVRLYNRWVAVKERQRIHSILLISSLFLVGATVAVFMDRTYWILFVFIAAVLDGYATFRKFT